MSLEMFQYEHKIHNRNIHGEKIFFKLYSISLAILLNY